MVIKCSKCGKERNYSSTLVKRLKSNLCKECCVNWNTGLTKETNEKVRVNSEKISKALKGKPKPWQKGRGAFFQGKTHTKKSREKMSKRLLGNNFGFQKGQVPWNKIGDGITPLYIRIRTSIEYKKWRKEIFKRDNYTCQKCGKRNGNGKTITLNIDHYPKTFSQIVKTNSIKSIDDAINCSELWNLEANRTLCDDCHKDTPTYRKG